MADGRDPGRLDRLDHRALVRRLSDHGRHPMSEHTPSSMRTPLGRVRHLGSAHAGTSHFWHQRLTSVADVPLTIAAIVIIIGLLGRNHAAVVQILGSTPGRDQHAAVHHHQRLSHVARHAGHHRGLRARRGRQVRHADGATRSSRSPSASPRCSRSSSSHSDCKRWRKRRPNGGAPKINGRAYPIEDHSYDVVVVGAGGSGLRAVVGCSEAGLQDRLHHQGVPDPLAHRRGAGRHRRRARQHGRGRLALAHVRHRQGRRLARRPGRHRIHGAARRRPRSTSSSTGACRSRAARRTARSTSGRSAA